MRLNREDLQFIIVMSLVLGMFAIFGKWSEFITVIGVIGLIFVCSFFSSNGRFSLKKKIG
jgi:hypothetical protein